MTLNCRTINMLILAEDKFPPFRVDVSTLFGKKLANMGYNIDWVMQSEKDCTKSYQIEWGGGCAWVAATDNGTNRYRRIKKHLLKIGNELRVLQLALKKRYKVLQVKDDFISALFAITAAKITRAKFVYWLSYPIPESDIYQYKAGTARYPLLYLIRGTLFKFLLYKIIMPSAEHIFVQSEQMKKDVADMGITLKKITSVPMGIELEKIPYVKAEKISTEQTTSDTSEKRILYLGTLIKMRRLDFLLEVFVKVLQKQPQTKLYFVGDGEDPQDRIFLEKKAIELNIADKVVFTGFLPMEEAWEYVRKADVCVSPFYPTFILNSTSPTKLIEYMAMGKPVVANDHPEQSLVVRESHGGLCVPYDHNAFAEAVLTILQNQSMAAKMGESGRRYVLNNRTYDVIAQAVHQKYQQICHENTSGK
nr:glycosyltransferase family 4 protein [Desulfobulbaceae bacterium]